jgi:hypothetical protein
VCGECELREGVIRCLDCYGGHSECRECILHAHQRLPFHRLEIWDGKCFTRTSLFDQGFVLHVGHGSRQCPSRTDSLWEDVKISEEDLMDADDVFDGHVDHDSIVVVVDSAGVFRHRVAWCACDKDLPMQLFREGLFPATYQTPKSAFIFRALDHFYIDAMECKTPAMSFYQKLRRLTNNAFPGKVYVRVCFSTTPAPILIPITSGPRIATENS